jgi:hypothetical protein
MLNRGAVIVRPKQPFMDWASSLDDSGILPDREGEKTIYLVPEYEDDFEAIEVLSQVYDIIFEEELLAWHTRESDWPKNRTFAMFREWFDVEYHSIVQDICGYALEVGEGEV